MAQRMRKLAFLLLSLFVVGSTMAKPTSSDEGKKGFSAGDLIMHHIGDAHEIHMFTLLEGTPDEKHVTIPLPIILYSDQGLEIFSSSNFHNDEHKHGRYILHHEHIYIAGANGGLELDAEGHPTNASPLDFSITKTVAGIFISIIIMFIIFSSVAKGYKQRPNQAPKGLQSFLEPIILFVRDEIAKPSIGEKKYEKFMPYLLTIFFFIWISNMLGLIPFIGGFNITGNISITLVLAIFTFIITQISGNKHYWGHIFAMPGVPKFVLPLLTPIEILGMITKPVVLCLRLFANITAGHIIILAFISLIFIFENLYGAAAGYGVSVVSTIFAIFMNVIEVLVAFLQAFVFTLLSALYFGSAVEEHAEHH